jgi:hypothetical protein
MAALRDGGAVFLFLVLATMQGGQLQRGNFETCETLKL